MGHLIRQVFAHDPISQFAQKHDPLGRSINNAIGLNPKPVPPIPTAPTLDTATQAVLDQQDQNARRKGVLANVFAGSAAPPPAVGKTTLGG